ncbi:MAG TPA: hypothetical protein DDW21_05160 [Verrucomicrobiales bacterium]|nr:MAG: hypothetical protein B9S37_01470 [Verrucomicrobiae bacterium Tous-C3TDCM]PAZ06682.1 MAG: hypothetical protein CAK88_03445 [Verrucomicrobiae bacterium AMD-G2]HBE22823.1 hypothetical protein [Verrucomicrobiales bacterium]
MPAKHQRSSCYPKSWKIHESISPVHHLTDILFISLCAVICGCESFEDMGEFGIAKEEWSSAIGICSQFDA